MRKRLTAVALSLILTISLLPMPAAAADKSERQQIRTAVEQVIYDYAKQVGRADAAGDAFRAFFNQGFFGNGEKMNLTEESAMTAALFGTIWLPLALTDGIAAGIYRMQSLCEDEIFLSAYPYWGQAATRAEFTAYKGDAWDYTNYLGTVATTKDICGSDNYQGPLNDNDEIMALLVGGLNTEILIRCVERNASSAVCRIDLAFTDRFDFDGENYENMKESNIDVGEDQKLNEIGFLLTHVGLDKFDWSFKTSFLVEVPLHCDHKDDAVYRWALDADSMQMMSDGSGDYTVNEAERKVYEMTNGDSFSYYELHKPVVLDHDAPWVVEIETDGVVPLMLSPLDTWMHCMPNLFYNGRDQAWISQGVLEDHGESKFSDVSYEMRYAGVALSGQYPYSANHQYIARYENESDAAQGNMIYISVIDATENKTVYGPEPLTNLWVQEKNGDKAEDQGQQTDLVVGQDLIINYIGTKASRVRPQAREVRIWENRADTVGSADTYRAPTCTEQGGTVRVCRDCGYERLTDAVPALGHSYGDYVFDSNASCTADGTQTRSCTVCGETETVTAPDSAKNHRMDGGTVVKEPTYDSTGLIEYTCLDCGMTFQENIPALMAAPFSDVSESDWFYLPVQWAVGREVTNGKTETTFAPNEGCTRAQVVTFLWAANGKPEPKSMDNPFEDVADNAWYLKPVLWAVENGITGGIAEGKFGPDNTCTRAQIVTFLYAAQNKPAVSGESSFGDVANDAWYVKSVLWASQNEVTGGIGGGNFGPNNTCTRGQVVTFLYKVYG